MEPRPPQPRSRHAHSRSHTAPRPLEPVVMTGSLGLAQPSTCWFVCHSKLCAFVKYMFLAMNKTRSWQKQWGCNRGCGAHLTAPMAGYFCFVLFLLYKFYDMLWHVNAQINATHLLVAPFLDPCPSGVLLLYRFHFTNLAQLHIGAGMSTCWHPKLLKNWAVHKPKLWNPALILLICFLLLYPNFSGWRSASSWTRLVKTYRKPQTTNQFCR